MAVLCAVAMWYYIHSQSWGLAGILTLDDTDDFVTGISVDG